MKSPAVSGDRSAKHEDAGAVAVWHATGGGS
jgi:hypothetical protein